MLHGKPPLENIISMSDVDDHFKHTNFKIKQGLSEDTSDLIQQMLELNQFKRIGIQGVIEHKALVKFRHSFGQTVDSSDLKNLRQTFSITTDKISQLECPENLLKNLQVNKKCSDALIPKPSLTKILLLVELSSCSQSRPK